MLHESLWQQNADITQRCLEHAFVRGLADGTLDRDVFRQYVAQDAFFLRAFLRRMHGPLPSAMTSSAHGSVSRAPNSGEPADGLSFIPGGPSFIPQANGGALLSGGKPGHPWHNQLTVRQRAQAVRGQLIGRSEHSSRRVAAGHRFNSDKTCGVGKGSARVGGLDVCAELRYTRRAPRARTLTDWYGMF